MRLRALVMGTALAFTHVTACSATELRITRGGNADWTWACAIGGHSGLHCGLQPVSAESIALTFDGIPRFAGPHIIYVPPNPTQASVVIRIDENPEVALARSSPESIEQFVAMLHGRYLFISSQGGRESAMSIKVGLNGLRQSYCEAMEYLTEHGAQPAEAATVDVRQLVRCD